MNEAPILIIDDHRTARELLRSHLKDLGYENIEEAIDGNMGIEKVRTGPDQGGSEYSVIFLDWMMPNFNGFEFLKWYRENFLSSSTKIVFVTAESERERVVDALQEGADDYLMKPYSREDLVRKLKRLIDPLS